MTLFFVVKITNLVSSNLLKNQSTGFFSFFIWLGSNLVDYSVFL
jgi:hypothetical protein